MKTNVDRLKEYKARLVVFPKKSDVNKDVIGAAPQLFTKPKASDSAVTFTEITPELKEFKAYATLRKARSDAKLVGIRLKKSKESKDEKPAAAAAKGGDDE